MKTLEETERDCNKCLWATRDGGCASWDCEFVSKQDAYDAWKAQQRPRRDRLIEVLREVREEE